MRTAILLIAMFSFDLAYCSRVLAATIFADDLDGTPGAAIIGTAPEVGGNAWTGFGAQPSGQFHFAAGGGVADVGPNIYLSHAGVASTLQSSFVFSSLASGEVLHVRVRMANISATPVSNLLASSRLDLVVDTSGRIYLGELNTGGDWGANAIGGNSISSGVTTGQSGLFTLDLYLDPLDVAGDGPTQNALLSVNSACLVPGSIVGLSTSTVLSAVLMIRNIDNEVLFDDILIQSGPLPAPCLCESDSALVVHYRFDEPSSLGLDSSANGLDGEIGAVGGARGSCGAALRFLPNNNIHEFDVPDHPLLDMVGAMTGSAWIRPWGPQSTDNNPGCTQGTIFSKGANYWFQVEQNNNGLLFQHDGGSPGASAGISATIPVGEWTHVAFVRSSGADNVKFYVNGVLTGAPAGYPLTPVASANGAPLMVGNYGSGSDPGACEFNGDIDEIRLYSRALNDGEILDLYSCDCDADTSLCSPEGTLVINTGFDQGAGVTKGVGTTDNEWIVIQDTNGSTSEPRPAFVIEPHGAWNGPLAGSRWLSSLATSENQANGLYVFEYRFCLDSPTGASLDLSLLADDFAAVYLNNQLVGSTTGAFTTPTPLSTTSFFVAGENRLRVDVQNTQAVAMGMNLAGTIGGQLPEYICCCADSTSGLLGTVWNDANGNGTRDNGEPGLAGVTVNLSDGQSRITDNFGNYYFMSLAPGVYTVSEVLPLGQGKTWPPAPGSYTLTLPGCEVIPGLDFGNMAVDVGDPAVPLPPCELAGRRIAIAEVTCCVGAGFDTVRFGGTVWAADSSRWEAVANEEWTFDTGVGSSINTGSNPNKPTGYHQTMNGWVGLDLSAGLSFPYFRRLSDCAISGSFSLAAGVTLAEAQSLCYATGAGYGNDWNLVVAKSFVYPGGQGIPFAYKYNVTAEDGHDFLCVLIDTTGDGSAEELTLAVHTGTTFPSPATNMMVLIPGTSMRSTPGPFVIRYAARSDAQYSDEDGGYDAPCALAIIDDITVGSDFSDFEGGPNGWSQEFSVAGGVGDFSNLKALHDLPPPVSLCPCSLADSVLVFHDQLDGHPLDQDNLAISPWIDLLAAGQSGKSGKAILYSVYGEMPLANYVFAQFAIRSYPDICSSSGQLTLGPWRRAKAAIYFGDAPFCSGVATSCAQDMTCESSASAEQVQIAVGVINLCRTAPSSAACTGVTNSTPWFDNISLGVFGSSSCPLVMLKPEGRLQDSFATDGTLNPAAPGRFDINLVRGGGPVMAGMTLGDTLVACGDGGNTEVRFVFRVRPGPFTSGAALAARAARWTLEPVLAARYGGAWYSARIDTAQQGSSVHPGCWMGTFHEYDPGFVGHDQLIDPNDPGALENEVLPDHILTPGARIDYFIASRYLPPDPRNPGGTAWCVDPDTTGGQFLEVEILPSSVDADTTWNCTLWVNHHADPCADEFAVEYGGLVNSLGMGSNNAENVRFDRYDVQRPTSFQLSFGRPLDSRHGASVIQSLAYRNIAWHSGRNSAGQLTREDADVLRPFLTLAAVGGNAFWGTGDNLAHSMHSEGGSQKAFLNSVLGATFTCGSIRSVNCPTGTPLDLTYCLPLQDVPGAYFQLSSPTFVHGNGCPETAHSDLLSANPSIPSARGNLAYVKSSAARNFASVTNYNTVDVTFRTVLDGMGVARLRENTGSATVGCDNVYASYSRTDDVLDWFGSPLLCDIRAGLSDATEVLPVERSRPLFLGDAHPNPMQRSVRILFDAGVSRRLRLDLFDVTGRRITTLFDGPALPGPQSVNWDGRSEDGRPAAAGLYFYRLSDGSTSLTRKLLLLK